METFLVVRILIHLVSGILFFWLSEMTNSYTGLSGPPGSKMFGKQAFWYVQCSRENNSVELTLPTSAPGLQLDQDRQVPIINSDLSPLSFLSFCFELRWKTWSSICAVQFPFYQQSHLIPEYLEIHSQNLNLGSEFEKEKIIKKNFVFM